MDNPSGAAASAAVYEQPEPTGRKPVLRKLTETEARAVLKEHTGLVRMVISRWFRPHLARQAAGLVYDDLLSIGQQALLEAMERWDPQRGALATIAVIRIRQRLAWWTRLDRDTGQRRAEEQTVVLDPADLEELGAHHHFEAEGHVDAALRRDWLRTVAPRVLTAQQLRVLRHILRGDTFADTGAALGITKQGAEMAYSAAVMHLRRAAVKQRLV